MNTGGHDMGEGQGRRSIGRGGGNKLHDRGEARVDQSQECAIVREWRREEKGEGRSERGGGRDRGRGRVERGGRGWNNGREGLGSKPERK